MDLLLKIKKNDLIIDGIFLLGLSSFNFYIFDPFYFPSLQKILIFFGFLLLASSIIPRKISYAFLFYLLYVLIYNYSGYLTHFFNQDYTSLYLRAAVFLIFYIYIENVENKYILRKSINLIIFTFILINFISFICFVLFVFKIPLPYENINLGSRGFNYNNYAYILIVCNYVTGFFGNFNLTRFNGVFEEPGMLGTYLGIIMIVNSILFPEKKKRNFFLIIMGVFTMSFAFYVVLFFIFLYNITFKKIIFSSIIISVFIFILIDSLPKQSLKYINQYTINRFTINNGHISGDSRILDHQKFRNYLDHVSTVTLIFGNGKNTNELDKDAHYSSYYSFIYESGLVGILLLLLIHLYYLVYIPIKHKQYKYLTLTIVPIILIYQGRQYIDFFVILYFLTFKVFFCSNNLLFNNK